MQRAVIVPFLVFFLNSSAQITKDDVLGRWISTDNSVSVNVYRVGNSFQAKVIWFDERLGSGTPMETRHDSENPDPKLRNRKVIGMDVLENLDYNSKTKRWENGKIYDASSGRTWDALAEIKKDGLLYVRGFWKFKWIGKTINFRRLRNQ
ncbi:DUF2147 domain-containing protein [Halpernia frigidisoli]|uniref:DUF2147 domain-containing protein n=1 Tax=Halpernia frigidisoli TaxID=1125876 RepID=A0A1I3J752_9FLAO|nr:DUF2147 domain-containing protein [Halpernia frigidisoli]SFI55946.1 hypothetical protein SAMN05443292_2964 [Halpernia frigidisoli]